MYIQFCNSAFKTCTRNQGRCSFRISYHDSYRNRYIYLWSFANKDKNTSFEVKRAVFTHRLMLRTTLSQPFIVVYFLSVRKRTKTNYRNFRMWQCLLLVKIIIKIIKPIIFLKSCNYRSEINHQYNGTNGNKKYS